MKGKQLRSLAEGSLAGKPVVWGLSVQRANVNALLPHGSEPQ
jgi:hypothetical protein